MFLRLAPYFRKFCYTLGLGILVTSCYKEVILPENVALDYNYRLFFNEIPVAFDTERKLILCSIDSMDLAGWEVQFTSNDVEIIQIDNDPVTDGRRYYFESIQDKKDYELALKFHGDKIEQYKLQFTILPVCQIFTEYDIPDDPKVKAWIIVSSGGSYEKALTSYIGIERRGGTAYYRPKHSFAIEFWENEYESAHKDVSFFNLMADDDWILDGMYIDKARMRNALSFSIWNDIQSDRLFDQSFRSTGISGGFVELFINNRLLGLYHLCERIDRKRLGIQPTSESIEGVIYKALDWAGATTYTELEEPRPDRELEWGGWKLKYPKEPSKKAWDPLYNYLDFALHSTDEDFTEHICEYINIGSAIDYFILLNITNAGDNWGKNIIMSRYDSKSPFLFLPWDMDATWGRAWDSVFTSTHNILTNNLYGRLFDLNISNFRNELSQRWEYLRQNVLQEQDLNSRIENYEALFTISGAFDRDKELWPEWKLNLAEEVEYMKGWNHQRIQYLDDFFVDIINKSGSVYFDSGVPLPH
jgi:hypothetical protein